MIYFVGASCGDKDLITVKAMKLLQKADVVLFTGSLISKDILSWCQDTCIIKDSQDMKYPEIFEFLEKYKNKITIRLHTGDPSIYSTIAKQISFLDTKSIKYKVIPAVSAAFGAAASLGIEYTIPGVSQTLVLSRIEGNTPNPQALDDILKLKNSSLVFYLSIQLLDKLKSKALQIGYSLDTPCWVVYKATWEDEKIYKGTIENIKEKVLHIKGIALILFGNFLYQKETTSSHLYTKPLIKS